MDIGPRAGELEGVAEHVSRRVHIESPRLVEVPLLADVVYTRLEEEGVRVSGMRFGPVTT